MPEFPLRKKLGAPSVLDKDSGAFTIPERFNLNHGLFSLFDSSGVVMQDIQLAKWRPRNCELHVQTHWHDLESEDVVC